MQAIARGTSVDDLVLWGMPATRPCAHSRDQGVRRASSSFKPESRSTTCPKDELCAGGHVLARQTLAELSALDAAALIAVAAPASALVIGRDGIGTRWCIARSAAVRRHRGAASTRSRLGCSARAASITVAEGRLRDRESMVGRTCDRTFRACISPKRKASTKSGSPGARVRETPIVFERAGQQLYAIVSQPLDSPVADGTIIMFNAGAIRRIGPNRIWTEAARRWAAAGVPVIRVDIEGIGDAGGEGGKYAEGDEAFYTPNLVEQARGALELAEELGLPDRFVLGGLCSGAYWSFELAASDPRVRGIMMLNPRLLVFDAGAEGNRELRKLGRILTRSGFRNMLLEKQKLRRAGRFTTYLFKNSSADDAPTGSNGAGTAVACVAYAACARTAHRYCLFGGRAAPGRIVRPAQRCGTPRNGGRSPRSPLQEPYAEADEGAESGPCVAR